MRKYVFVIILFFISFLVFAQTDSELFQQKLEQVYKPSVRNAIKISFDVLEGVGQLPKGTEFMGQQSNQRNVFNYTDYSMDVAKLEIIFFRNFSGVGGNVQITYSGRTSVAIEWFHTELTNILLDYYGAYDTLFTDDGYTVRGKVSPINSRNRYNFTLIYRESSSGDYTRLFLESIDF